MLKINPFGRGDATYQAIGGEDGIRQLVDRFYDLMESNVKYRTIWSWHPENKLVSRDKLACFLSGWMGGPALYNEKYGAINIPQSHAHLNVTLNERDQWINCMTEAMESLQFPVDLKEYLISQLLIPAERIRQVCESNAEQSKE